MDPIELDCYEHFDQGLRAENPVDHDDVYFDKSP
jgi:hypothetical protein